MNGDANKPLGAGRQTMKNRLAEQIASTADRLEEQAAEVRTTDKQLALQLMKEATRLRRVARGIDIQHKRALRARMRRKGIHPATPPHGVSQSAWLGFARRGEDDAKAG